MGSVSEGPPAHDVSCVAHVHTTYSDGTATVPELLSAARETGVEAVLLSDHDTLQPRRDGWEGHHGGVFLLVGEEVSPRQGHYLAFGVEEETGHRGRSPGEIAAAVRAAGGVGFAAHPFSEGGHMLIAPLAKKVVLPHGWPALEEEGGMDGIELWSLLTDAAEAWRTPFEALRWMRDPERAMATGPPAHHLRAWDALSARRRVPAIGGHDGHEPGVRLRGRVRSPLSHRRTFGLLRTQLLCRKPLGGDAPSARRAILEALAGGSAWLACPCVAPAHGARLWAELDGGELVPMGGEAAAERGVLRLRLPLPAAITVHRDGTTIAAARAARLDLDLEGPGAYRVEARLEGRLWLLSNPVHLRRVGAASEVVG
jgi:predicted metal-dependent phosphoesterase TrpH